MTTGGMADPIDDLHEQLDELRGVVFDRLKASQEHADSEARGVHHRMDQIEDLLSKVEEHLESLHLSG